MNGEPYRSDVNPLTDWRLLSKVSPRIQRTIKKSLVQSVGEEGK